MSYKHRSYRRTDSPLSHRISLPEWTHRWKEREEKEREEKDLEKEKEKDLEEKDLEEKDLEEKDLKEKEKDLEEKEKDLEEKEEQVSLDTSPSYNHSWTYTERWPRNSSKKGTHYRPVGP